MRPLARLLHVLADVDDYEDSDEDRLRLIAKLLHVFSVGLWFGATVFFTFVVALSLFSSFEAEAAKPDAERPVWFPVTWQSVEDAAVRKEQGTLLAGYTVRPLFNYYFLLQGICGFVAAVTALGWWRAEPGSRVHKVRALIALCALATVIAGWQIERHVSALRDARNTALEAETQSYGKTRGMIATLGRNPGIGWQFGTQRISKLQAQHESLVAVAKTAREEFSRWHLYSLTLNFVTIILVTVAMALTARLPERSPAQPQAA
jgi:hypothetical protein